MTDLRALLGERYDVVMQAACGCDGTRTPHCYECSDSTWDHKCPDLVPCRHRAAESVLARVLPDLLDAAAAERDALAAKVAALADWHETKAEKARRFRIEIDGRNPVMDKAAEVHTDAARRLRAATRPDQQCPCTARKDLA